MYTQSVKHRSCLSSALAPASLSNLLLAFAARLVVRLQWDPKKLHMKTSKCLCASIIHMRSLWRRGLPTLLRLNVNSSTLEREVGVVHGDCLASGGWPSGPEADVNPSERNHSTIVDLMSSSQRDHSPKPPNYPPQSQANSRSPLWGQLEPASESPTCRPMRTRLKTSDLQSPNKASCNHCCII